MLLRKLRFGRFALVWIREKMLSAGQEVTHQDGGQIQHCLQPRKTTRESSTGAKAKHTEGVETRAPSSDIPQLCFTSTGSKTLRAPVLLGRGEHGEMETGGMGGGCCIPRTAL